MGLILLIIIECYDCFANLLSFVMTISAFVSHNMVDTANANAIASPGDDCGLHAVKRPTSFRFRNNVEDIYESLCYVTLKPQAVCERGNWDLYSMLSFHYVKFTNKSDLNIFILKPCSLCLLEIFLVSVLFSSLCILLGKI